MRRGWRRPARPVRAEVLFARIRRANARGHLAASVLALAVAAAAGRGWAGLAFVFGVALSLGSVWATAGVCERSGGGAAAVGGAYAGKIAVLFLALSGVSLFGVVDAGAYSFRPVAWAASGLGAGVVLSLAIDAFVVVRTPVSLDIEERPG